MPNIRLISRRNGTTLPEIPFSLPPALAEYEATMNMRNTSDLSSGKFKKNSQNTKCLGPYFPGSSKKTRM